MRAHTRLIARPLAVCAALWLCGPFADARAGGAGQDTSREPAADPPAITTSLRALGDLLARVAARPGASPFDLPRAQGAVSRLQALSVAWPAVSPTDYRINLAREVITLRAAIDGGNAKRLTDTLRAIAEDLEIKLEHCTRSGGKLGGSVVVRVRSVRGGDEIKNWQVFYMPRVLEAAGNATPERFPRLSSPTDETLVPGRYVMWLRNPNTNTVGERTIVKVGEGRKELLLELPVPADPSR